ncbi:unnamed protein product [Owenia fusiformis]|uniref:Uncharacterized protein n=1 Tax=Owenia fusiformis TaxID=6347 RepID=A0A8J1USZ9_OWEFU|nr:unnamed protein product [Owenia fusiformis]
MANLSISQYAWLCTLVVARLTLFNARRGEEGSRLTNEEWIDAMVVTWLSDDCVQHVKDDGEKYLIGQFKLAYLAGKGNQSNLIFLNLEGGPTQIHRSLGPLKYVSPFLQKADSTSSCKTSLSVTDTELDEESSVMPPGACYLLMPPLPSPSKLRRIAKSPRYNFWDREDEARAMSYFQPWIRKQKVPGKADMMPFLAQGQFRQELTWDKGERKNIIIKENKLKKML